MGQIVNRKKKGRPAKADPGARNTPPPERDLRRSLRRRNVKYVFDLDDYFDEDELFVDDERPAKKREEASAPAQAPERQGERVNGSARSARRARADHIGLFLVRRWQAVEEIFIVFMRNRLIQKSFQITMM